MKYKEDKIPITNKDINRLRMRIYREFHMSQSQKEKVKEYDRKKAEARQLKLKLAKDVEKKSITNRKRKSRVKHCFPESPTKYAKIVKKKKKRLK